MLTRKDFIQLEKTFVTKEDLRNTVKEFKEAVIKFKDEVLKEIKDMRDEISILVGYRDTIDDREGRIERIEKHLKLKTS